MVAARLVQIRTEQPGANVVPDGDHFCYAASHYHFNWGTMSAPTAGGYQRSATPNDGIRYGIYVYLK